MMKRREFMGYLAGGLAAATLNGKETLLLGRSRRISHPAYLLSQRIGISSWSFYNFFPSTRSSDYRGPDETFALLDFPKMMADRYRVHHLEFVAPHFASTEPAYLGELRSQLIRARSYLVNLPIDIPEMWTGGGLSDPSESVRDAAVEAAKKWIDIAVHLRARSVRCDPGKMNPQNLAPTIDSYKRLAAYARRKNIRVIVENHGGVGSEHPEDLVKVFKGVNSRYLGALPDFGNFPDAKTRARGLGLLFPYAPTVCHAKGLEFDAQGNEMKYNFPACVEIAKRESFRGVYSVEFEGSGDPYQGVQDVINELLRDV
ncbi:MAG TPA: TIM barrel protein [Terriglobia bacterium]|nr:TIM barrel protein [Terriglobia bacterium]